MPPAEHAVLSPSAAGRWLQCPASIRAIEKIPRGPESVYAAEGTTAHALAELELSNLFGKITSRQYHGRLNKWRAAAALTLSDESIEEMHGHVQTYVDLVVERVALFPNSAVLLEQRMPTGVPTCWGTSDTVIVSPEHVEIIDLKYGVGVPVSALDNPQIRLYGVGALEEYGDMLGEAKVVRMTICQPRLDSVSTEEVTADYLRAWRDSIIPIAKEALGDNARFGPSESACRWCPAAGDCRARIEYMTRQDFTREPDLITNDELTDLLGQLPDIRRWVGDVEEAALRKTYSEGQTIPGWKVVKSGGIRKVSDQDLAVETFTQAGFAREDVLKTSLRGVGDLETIIRGNPAFGKKTVLEDVLGSLVFKTEGKPSLVHESDPRPAINPDAEAAKEFL